MFTSSHAEFKITSDLFCTLRAPENLRSIFMKRIKIGDLVQSDYGRGRVLAETKEWFIHDNSEEGGSSEYAILKSDDFFEIISEKELLAD